MNMRIIASTKPGYMLSLDDALLLAGHEAGICYMREDFDTILHEPRTRTMGRVRGTVGSGHHSVSGHPSYNLVLEGLPKIIAMLLNNENDYNTSEKSARYTKMLTSPEEQVIYEKWIEIFKKLISEKYAQIEEKTVEKLAMENARYFISVFTPATTMGYTVDLRQINYLIGFCDKMYEKPSDDPFMELLKPWLKELADMFRGAFNVDGLRDNKGREFSLFARRFRKETVDENYCVNYYGTFSQLAQAQRHRSLYYEMMIPQLDKVEFYVPPIIEDEGLRAEYLADMESLKHRYPQGMLIHINERGTIEKFCAKCCERLCGAAQREICIQTEKTLQRLMAGAIEGDYPEVFAELMHYDGETKCQFGYYVCDRPCPLGPKQAFTRLI